MHWFHPGFQGFQKRFGEYFCNGFILDFTKVLESIFAMVSSWISKKVWGVFLQWFHPGFQKRFGEYFCNVFILDFTKGLESIFAMVPSWISQKVWKVFLQWFLPGFQKRFGEPRLCRAVEASTQLLVLQHSSSSKAIVDDGDDEDDDDNNYYHYNYHGDCDCDPLPPRQMLTPSVNLLGGTPLACYMVGTC